MTDAIVPLENILVADGDNTAIERWGLVNYCKLMSNLIVIDCLIQMDVRPTTRWYCKGLGVKFVGKISKFCPAISHDKGSLISVKVLRLLDGRCIIGKTSASPKTLAQAAEAVKFGEEGVYIV